MKKSDIIATALKAKGYNVVWTEETEDRIAIGIDFIGIKELPWIRAFHLEKAADPNAFVLDIEAWKKDVRDHMAFGVASPTVRSVIAHYGMARTKKALAAHG